MRTFCLLFCFVLLNAVVACGDNIKLGACEVDEDCVSDDNCKVGVCTPEGTCETTDLVCDDGLFCNGVEMCVPSTGCVSGSPPVMDDGVACTDDSCDEENDIIVNAVNNANCDDGTFCNGAEVCDAVDNCLAGTPPEIDDGIACTVDSCDEDNDVVVNAPDDTFCADGQFCNGAEVCDTANDCVAGTPPQIDDGIACTTDSCDEVNDVVVNAPDDTFCADGLFCNGVEVCDTVNDCVAGTPPVLDDGVTCTDDSCDEVNDVVVNAPNDGNCNDALFCNGVETCDAIADCQAGTPPSTDDGVACTDDSCDEASDSIVNVPNNANCADGLFCNGAEICDAVADCQAGTPPNVDDGVACTDDSCDEAGDRIVNAPNDGNCTDGLFCNGAEVCDAVNDCGPGTPPVIDDGVACTDDSCDEAGDRVVNAPNDGLCSDGLFCNGPEICDVVNDCGPGTPPVIDDGVVCTIDSCDEVNDTIVHLPDDTACDDGDTCTASDFCDPVLDCQNIPTDPVCGVCPNCGFETGDFTNWTIQDLTSPLFSLRVVPAGTSTGFFFPSAPTEGNFAAFHGFDGDGPGVISVGQDFDLHPGSPSATLTFDYRIAWDLNGPVGNPATQPRTLEVLVEPAGGGIPLQTDVIIIAPPGTENPDSGNLTGSVDLTPFIGQTVFIRFVWVVPEDFTGPGTAQLDNIVFTL